MLFGRRRRLPERIVLAAPDVTVTLRPSTRARRFTLRPTDEANAVLTLPVGTGEAEARAFLARHAGWLARTLARMPQPIAVRPGVRLPIDGVPVEIVRDITVRRIVRLDGERLRVGAAAAPGPAVAGWLRARARDRLAERAGFHAALLGRPIRGLALRDTRSRWGSCSAAGRLSFSWRIAMAPPEVQDYLAAHEVAHLAELNHSARYWAVLARLLPGYERPRAWLKREGRSLHRYRFEASASEP